MIMYFISHSCLFGTRGGAFHPGRRGRRAHPDIGSAGAAGNVVILVGREVLCSIGAAVRAAGRPLVATLSIMLIVRSILLFILAAFAEIGGAWLIWQGVREHRGLLWIGAGVIALGLYGL